MKIIKTKINNVYIIKQKIFKDKRGSFLESYKDTNFKKFKFLNNFVQDNISFSKKNVLRGMHYQINNPQSQLVTILSGIVYDVCVDLRPWSKTFKKCISVDLDSNKFSQLLMGPGIAHGYYVKSENALIHYKVDKSYKKTNEFGLKWNDSTININWPCKNPFINKKDKSFKSLKNFVSTDFPEKGKLNDI